MDGHSRQRKIVQINLIIKSIMYDDRDSNALNEVLNDRKRNKIFFLFWFAKNWFLERLAAIAPIPTWRVKLHRWRGIIIGMSNGF